MPTVLPTGTDGTSAGAGESPDGESGADTSTSSSALHDPLASLAPDLARIIRHDIKTPLQAASLNLELLGMEHEGDEGIAASIASIQESLDTAVAMLKRFEAH